MCLIFAINFSSFNDKVGILILHRSKKKIMAVLVFINTLWLLPAALVFLVTKFLVTDQLELGKPKIHRKL